MSQDDVVSQENVEYTFNASALGIGGRYVQGGREIVVPSLASVALASTGGDGSTEVGEYKSEAIAFKSARSWVSGRCNGTTYTTRSEIVIEGLSIFNKVSVTKLRAVVTSTRDASQPEEEGTFEVDAEYEGVMADDCVVEPLVHDKGHRNATYRHHHQQVMSSRGPSLAAGRKGSDASAERGDSVRTSVVKALPMQILPETGLETDGNVLIVPGIGRIYFGELLVKRGKRRVSLMRVELGPKDGAERLMTATPYIADSGMLSIGSGDGNGEPIWPRN
jgi:hypothetical protein